MQAINFPQVNLRLAEDQPEYETLPVCVESYDNYFNKVTACFELSEEEIEQIIKNRKIWYTVLQPKNKGFNPIKMSLLNPITEE